MFIADSPTAWVVLQAQTPTGIAVYFLEPGAAIELARMLRTEGKAALAQASNGHSEE